MPTVKTDADVVSYTLQKLYALEGGATPSAEDQATALRALDSRVEWLRDEGVCWWNDDEVPLSAFDPLAEYLTYYVAIYPFAQRMQFKPASDEGLRDLRRLAAKAAEGSPIRAEYF